MYARIYPKYLFFRFVHLQCLFDQIPMEVQSIADSIQCLSIADRSAHPFHGPAKELTVGDRSYKYVST